MGKELAESDVEVTNSAVGNSQTVFLEVNWKTE